MVTKTNATNTQLGASELLSITEAAEATRLTESTIRAWLNQRRIPCVKLGRRVLLRRADLVALIEAGFVPATKGESNAK
jgi:excisionase family DNA binding protein